LALTAHLVLLQLVQFRENRLGLLLVVFDHVQADWSLLAADLYQLGAQLLGFTRQRRDQLFAGLGFVHQVVDEVVLAGGFVLQLFDADVFVQLKFLVHLVGLAADFIVKSAEFLCFVPELDQLFEHSSVGLVPLILPHHLFFVDADGLFVGNLESYIFGNQNGIFWQISETLELLYFFAVLGGLDHHCGVPEVGLNDRGDFGQLGADCGQVGLVLFDGGVAFLDLGDEVHVGLDQQAALLFRQPFLLQFARQRVVQVHPEFFAHEVQFGFHFIYLPLYFLMVWNYIALDWIIWIQLI